MNLPEYVADYSDERHIGHPIFISLKRGLSFDPYDAEHTRTFENVRDARRGLARKRIYTCPCEACEEYRAQK